MKVDRRRLLQAMSVGVALAPVLSLNSVFASECDSRGQEASPGAKFVQMDPNVSFDQQIVNNVAPVVLLCTFLVQHEHVEEFLAGFRKQFSIMRKQPGLISAQLHRGIAGSCLFMNYPKPLSGFLFSRDQKAIDHFLASLSFGGGAINQVNDHNSGY
jgi:hypothetical protein